MRIHRYTYLYVYNTWWFRYILYNICIKRIYIKYYPKYNIKCIKIQALSFIREYIETSKYDKGYDIICVVAGARAGIDASDTATSTLEAWWDGVWRFIPWGCGNSAWSDRSPCGGRRGRGTPPGRRGAARLLCGSTSGSRRLLHASLLANCHLNKQLQFM